MDRYRFACIAAEIFNVDKELLIPVSTPEMKQRAVRPLNAGLRIEKVQSVVSSQLIGPREGLSLMKERGNPFVS